jgi:hypothetical protein
MITFKVALPEQDFHTHAIKQMPYLNAFLASFDLYRQYEADRYPSELEKVHTWNFQYAEWKKDAYRFPRRQPSGIEFQGVDEEGKEIVYGNFRQNSSGTYELFVNYQGHELDNFYFSFFSEFPTIYVAFICDGDIPLLAKSHRDKKRQFIFDNGLNKIGYEMSKLEMLNMGLGHFNARVYFGGINTQKPDEKG